LIIKKAGRRASLSWGGSLLARLVQFAAIDANELVAPRPLLGGAGCAIGVRLSASGQPNKPFAADGPGTVFIEFGSKWRWSGWRAGCKIGAAFAGEAVSGVQLSFGRVAIEPPLKRSVRQESFGAVNGSEDSYFVGRGQSAANGAAYLSLTGLYFTSHGRPIFTTRGRPVFTTRGRPVFTRHSRPGLPV